MQAQALVVSEAGLHSFRKGCQKYVVRKKWMKHSRRCVSYTGCTVGIIQIIMEMKINSVKVSPFIARPSEQQTRLRLN